MTKESNTSYIEKAITYLENQIDGKDIQELDSSLLKK